MEDQSDMTTRAVDRARHTFDQLLRMHRTAAEYIVTPGVISPRLQVRIVFGSLSGAVSWHDLSTEATGSDSEFDIPPVVTNARFETARHDFRGAVPVVAEVTREFIEWVDRTHDVRNGVQS